MSKGPDRIKLKIFLTRLLSNQWELKFDEVIGKIEKAFRIEADDELRARVREMYPEVREKAQTRRRIQSGLKLLAIAVPCLAIAVFFILSRTYDIPAWLKIGLIAVGLPAWFLGIFTLLPRDGEKKPPLPPQED